MLTKRIRSSFINKILRANIVAWSVVAVGHIASAGGFGDDNVTCADDRPCFNAMYESGNTVVFRFTGVTGWDYYNVRYPVNGGGDKQVENRSGSFTFTGTQPNRIYNLRVQGCNSNTLARSTCTPWVEASFATAPAAPTARAPFQRLQVKHSGKYLDAVNCSAQVALSSGSTYAAGACQLWRFVPAGGGWNRLQLKQGGKYLDASYCSDNVVLNGSSAYAEGACQLWRLVPAGGGWNRLQLKQGGKYLDASYCSDKVVLNGSSTYAEGACQLWRFVGDSR
jgi:hypothetical protein